MNSNIELEHGDNITDFFRIKKTTKNLQQQYSDLVTRWEKCLKSDKNNKYGERLFKITQRMDEVRNKILKSKGIKDV